MNSSRKPVALVGPVARANPAAAVGNPDLEVPMAAALAVKVGKAAAAERAAAALVGTASALPFNPIPNRP